MHSLKYVFSAVGLAALLSLAVAGSAAAVPCGQPEKAGDPATQGILTLDPTQSNTSWKDASDDDSFVLYLKVSGCSIAGQTGLTATPRSPNGHVRKALGAAVVAPPKTNTIVVTVPIDKGQLPAGDHSATLSVSGDTVADTLVPLTTQHKNGPWIPLLFGVLALIAGIVIAVWKGWLSAGGADKKPVEWRKGYFLALVGAAVVPAGAAWWAAYGKSDTWALNFPNILLLVVAVGGAAIGGAAAGPIKKYVHAKPKAKKDHPGPPSQDGDATKGLEDREAEPAQ